MKDIGFFNKIYLSVEPVDFRRQAGGLSLLVEHKLNMNPMATKTLFIFTNKRKNSVKILYWDGTGFALWWKSLERDRFRWPKSKKQAMELGARELRWLLEGIDFTKIKKHEKVILS